MTEKKIVITMEEIMEHRALQRAEENAYRHMKGIDSWINFKKDEEYERDEQQELILMEINQIVNKNIVYGSPPYSLESAEEILLDIINDLTSMKERLGLDSSEL